MESTADTIEITPAPREIAFASPGSGPQPVLRPVRPGDADGLRDLFEGMSERSRSLRFMQAMPRVPSSLIRYLAGADGHRHVAWVATVGGRIVAEACSIRLDEDASSAEIALSIDDAHQGRGLGRRLLEVLHAAAADAGIERFVYTMSTENEACRGLMRSFGGVHTFVGGVLEGTMPVRSPAASRAA